MAQLKCWIGNLDGQRDALVIATSQTKAAKALKITLHGFRPYFSEQGEVPDHLKPDTMYTKDNRRFNESRFEGWTEGRCELAKRGTVYRAR